VVVKRAAISTLLDNLTDKLTTKINHLLPVTANYNADDDEEYLAAQKNGSIIGRIQPTAADNNNLLTVPQPICDQPMGRNGGNSTPMRY